MKLWSQSIQRKLDDEYELYIYFLPNMCNCGIKHLILVLLPK